MTTRQYFEIAGRTPTGMLEQHASWSIRWSPGTAEAPPRVRSITVEDFADR